MRLIWPFSHLTITKISSHKLSLLLSTSQSESSTLTGRDPSLCDIKKPNRHTKAPYISVFMLEYWTLSGSRILEDPYKISRAVPIITDIIKSSDKVASFLESYCCSCRSVSVRRIYCCHVRCHVTMSDRYRQDVMDMPYMYIYI